MTIDARFRHHEHRTPTPPWRPSLRAGGTLGVNENYLQRSPGGLATRIRAELDHPHTTDFAHSLSAKRCCCDMLGRRFIGGAPYS
jgi:hypothetical protein